MHKGLKSLTPDPRPLAPAGLYVHIPFCQSKCPYCDFYSLASPDLIPAYLGALEKEAQIYQDKVVANACSGVSPGQAQAKACGYQDISFSAFDSLFLGGGTPSLLTAEQFGRLLQILRRHFEFAADSEITLEANPDDVTSEKLQVWQDLGVNRLSLGVQSLDEAELRFLGRRHTARQTRQALEMIRGAGFNNLSLDLMYGLPGQTEAAWVKTLEEALEFAPEHLSCYQLTIAPDTPLGEAVARGQVTPLEEEAQRAFFLLSARFLTDRGYRHYEVSNFAREEGPQARGLCYCCRHNLKYWRHVPYLGLGPAAHSFDGRRRWWNFSSVDNYCSRLGKGAPAVAGDEILTPEQIRLEALSLGLRTREGVDLAVIGPQARRAARLQELQASGLVRVAGGRVRPTLEGLALADRLALWLSD